MLIAIALINGVTDINLIISISVLTGSCQLCGLAVEYVDDKQIKWLIHVVGWIKFLWAYRIIGYDFLSQLMHRIKQEVLLRYHLSMLLYFSFLLSTPHLVLCS